MTFIFVLALIDMDKKIDCNVQDIIRSYIVKNITIKSNPKFFIGNKVGRSGIVENL